MRRFVKDLQRLSALGQAMADAGRRNPSEIELEEIEPGVFAMPAPRPRRRGQLGAVLDQAEHITRAFGQLEGRLCRR